MWSKGVGEEEGAAVSSSPVEEKPESKRSTTRNKSLFFWRSQRGPDPAHDPQKQAGAFLEGRSQPEHLRTAPSPAAPRPRIRLSGSGAAPPGLSLRGRGSAKLEQTPRPPPRHTMPRAGGHPVPGAPPGLSVQLPARGEAAARALRAPQPQPRQQQEIAWDGRDCSNLQPTGYTAFHGGGAPL